MPICDSRNYERFHSRTSNEAAIQRLFFCPKLLPIRRCVDTNAKARLCLVDTKVEGKTNAEYHDCWLRE